MSAADPYDLQRFVDAQDGGGSYRTALSELQAGRKRSHWMWYVLPQLRGLGSSAMAERYGITGLAEAQAYLAHPVLGPRLDECVAALGGLPQADPVRVLGSVDAQKLGSCLTLFERAADDPGRAAGFTALLERWFPGRRDPATLERLNDAGDTSGT